MISSLNELLAYSLNFNDTLQLVIFIQCITETKEPSLWKKFGAKNAGFFSMSLPAKDVEMIEVDLVNLISSSGCREWVMEVGPKFSKLAETIKAFVAVNLEIREGPTLEDMIQLWPKVALAGGEAYEKSQTSFEGDVLITEKRILKIDVFFCRAIREILQRVLQLFTEFTLRGDSSSASYVSFLSCSCFEKAVIDKISFEPIIPVKFFTVQNASKKAGRKGSDASVTAHLRGEHSDEGVELVVLLFPSVKTVRFILPSGNELQQIRLSGKHLPDFSHEQSLLPDLEVTVQCSPALDSFPSRTESVLPDMPLIMNTKVSTVLTPISLPPADKRPLSVTEHVSEDGHYAETSTPKAADSRKDSLQPRPVQYALQASDESGPSMKVSSILHSHTTAFQQQPSEDLAIQPVQQQYSRRLATMKPGAVIFTADPNKIPIDRPLPLPDPSMLIQSGGNGQIFASTVQGLDVVMKKTSYRSKEYSIITKVRHENVIRLLAFVMGEENPAHKRRYLCYHIISKMTGIL